MLIFCYLQLHPSGFGIGPLVFFKSDLSVTNCKDGCHVEAAVWMTAPLHHDEYARAIFYLLTIDESGCSQLKTSLLFEINEHKSNKLLTGGATPDEKCDLCDEMKDCTQSKEQRAKVEDKSSSESHGDSDASIDKLSELGKKDDLHDEMTGSVDIACTDNESISTLLVIFLLCFSS